MMRFLPYRGAALAALGAAFALCGVANCLAQVDHPPGREPGPPAQGQVEPAPPPDRGKLANRLDEIGPLLSKCLQMPPLDIARPGMRVTLRLAFTRDGEILGEPRFTFATPGVPPEIKAAYQRAAVDMLNRCTPLPITKELGGAIAGRPFAIPIIETRKEKKAENSDAPKS
jgi:hypothetical protein